MHCCGFYALSYLLVCRNRKANIQQAEFSFYSVTNPASCIIFGGYFLRYSWWWCVFGYFAAHSSLDDHLARWFGLNQSKYQWALDDYYESKGLVSIWLLAFLRLIYFLLWFYAVMFSNISWICCQIEHCIDWSVQRFIYCIIFLLLCTLVQSILMY